MRGWAWVPMAVRRGVPPAIACGLVLAVSAARGQGPGLDELEALVGQWIDVRAEIAEEERAWVERERQWARESAVLKRELDALTASMEEAAGARDAARSEQADLAREHARLSGDLEALASLVARAEAGLLAWAPRIPPSLRGPLDEGFRRLPADPAGADNRSLGMRLQVVLGLYTEIERLQSQVSTGKEVLSGPAGTRREMDVIYLGLAQGYAVSADGEHAATGAPTADGWVWTPRNESAAAIRGALAILHREQPPVPVVLPLRVPEESR